jgi:hypothetical protein
MLPKIRTMADRIIADCEDPAALDAEDLAYLEQIKTVDDLGNFTDASDDKMLTLALDAAKALGKTPAQCEHLENEWRHRRAGRTAEIVRPELFEENPYDFSWSGLGIGGINDDQSMPEIPSLAVIGRQLRLAETDIICRRCGASMHFDGAMFTNGGGDVCDDCFG